MSQVLVAVGRGVSQVIATPSKLDLAQVLVARDQRREHGQQDRKRSGRLSSRHVCSPEPRRKLCSIQHSDRIVWRVRGNPEWEPNACCLTRSIQPIVHPGLQTLCSRPTDNPESNWETAAHLATTRVPAATQTHEKDSLHRSFVAGADDHSLHPSAAGGIRRRERAMPGRGGQPQTRTRRMEGSV